MEDGTLSREHTYIHRLNYVYNDDFQLESYDEVRATVKGGELIDVDLEIIESIIPQLLAATPKEGINSLPIDLGGITDLLIDVVRVNNMQYFGVPDITLGNFKDLAIPFNAGQLYYKDTVQRQLGKYWGEVPVVDEHGEFKFDLDGNLVMEAAWRELDVTTHTIWEALDYGPDGVTAYKETTESSSAPGKITERYRTNIIYGPGKQMIGYQDKVHEYGTFEDGTVLDLNYEVNWEGTYSDGVLTGYVEETTDDTGMVIKVERSGIEYYGTDLIKSYLQKTFENGQLVSEEVFSGGKYDEKGYMTEFRKEITDPDGNKQIITRHNTVNNMFGQVLSYSETHEYTGNLEDVSTIEYYGTAYDLSGNMLSYLTETTDSFGVYAMAVTGMTYDLGYLTGKIVTNYAEEDMKVLDQQRYTYSYNSQGRTAQEVKDTYLKDGEEFRQDAKAITLYEYEKGKLSKATEYNFVYLDEGVSFTGKKVIENEYKDNKLYKQTTTTYVPEAEFDTEGELKDEVAVFASELSDPEFLGIAQDFELRDESKTVSYKDDWDYKGRDRKETVYNYSYDNGRWVFMQLTEKHKEYDIRDRVVTEVAKTYISTSLDPVFEEDLTPLDLSALVASAETVTRTTGFNFNNMPTGQTVDSYYYDEVGERIFASRQFTYSLLTAGATR